MGEVLEVGAGLAEAAADALGLADAEAKADEGVEVDFAGDDVAARLRGGRPSSSTTSASISVRSWPSEWGFENLPAPSA